MSSRLVIETILNTKEYCSRASASVRFSGHYCTKNSSTYVERRLCLTRVGSERASTFWIDALPPGASLPRMGAIVCGAFLLLAGPRLEALCLPRVMK